MMMDTDLGIKEAHEIFEDYVCLFSINQFRLRDMTREKHWILYDERKNSFLASIVIFNQTFK